MKNSRIYTCIYIYTHTHTAAKHNARGRAIVKTRAALSWHLATQTGKEFKRVLNAGGKGPLSISRRRHTGPQVRWLVGRLKQNPGMLQAIGSSFPLQHALSPLTFESVECVLGVCAGSLCRFTYDFLHQTTSPIEKRHVMQSPAARGNAIAPPPSPCTFFHEAD